MIAAIVIIGIVGLVLIGMTIWQWRCTQQLQRELDAGGEARAAALQNKADAKIAQIRAETEKRHREALAALNREAVHVDPDDPNLADVFDRATGGRRDDS